MEQNKDIMQMLDLMVCPAFCVKGGIVTAVNAAASQKMLSGEIPVAEILATGQQEYADFTGGCLYLTLRIEGAAYGASVTRINGVDVFIMEQEEDQAQLQVMALAAQELRKPLSTMLSLVDDLLPMPCLSESQEASDTAARINRGLTQMHRIICNMSDAYLYSQEAPSRMEIRDVGALLQEQFTQSAELLKSANIGLKFTGLHETVYSLVSAERLERAVHNILANAGRFSPQGGVIDAKLTRKGSMLYLTVHDNGCGIADSVIGNVYSRYLRQPGIEDGNQGIGLGMVLIRSAATAHGGAVLIEKSADQGTRITMTIPIKQDVSGVRSPAIHVDYAGERDHKLLELSECLPAELYGANH